MSRISPLMWSLRTKPTMWFVTRTLPKNIGRLAELGLGEHAEHLDVGRVARLRVPVGVCCDGRVRPCARGRARAPRTAHPGEGISRRDGPARTRATRPRCRARFRCPPPRSRTGSPTPSGCRPSRGGCPAAACSPRRSHELAAFALPDRGEHGRGRRRTRAPPEPADARARRTRGAARGRKGWSDRSPQPPEACEQVLGVVDQVLVEWIVLRDEERERSPRLAVRRGPACCHIEARVPG